MSKVGSGFHKFQLKQQPLPLSGIKAIYHPRTTANESITRDTLGCAFTGPGLSCKSIEFICTVESCYAQCQGKWPILLVVMLSKLLKPVIVWIRGEGDIYIYISAVANKLEFGFKELHVTNLI